LDLLESIHETAHGIFMATSPLKKRSAEFTKEKEHEEVVRCLKNIIGLLKS
jgi:hypothetical protein